MNIILGIIISSIIGSTVFVFLLMLRPITGKIFSKSWHYYMLLVPLLLLLGGTHVGIGIAGLIPGPAVGSQAYDDFPSESHQYVRIPAENHQYNHLPADENQNSSANYGSVDDDSHLGMVVVSESVPSRNVFSLINGEFFIRGLRALAPFLLVIWIVGATLYLGINKVAYLRYRRVLLENSNMVTTIKVTSLYTRFCSLIHATSQVQSAKGVSQCARHGHTIKLTQLKSRSGHKIPVMTTKYTDTPMLIGILKPMIVLPNLYLVDEELEMVLEHELTHYRRKDLIVKLAMLIANAIHWFNPLVYALSKQLSIMCELSCDEKVVLQMDNPERRLYGETILYVLENSTGKKDLNCNAAFATNQTDSKERIRNRLTNVLRAKKMKKLTIVIAMIAGVLIIGGSVIAASTLNGVIPANEDINPNVASLPTIAMDDTIATATAVEDMADTATTLPPEIAMDDAIEIPTATGERADRSEHHIVVNGVGLALMYDHFTLAGEAIPTHVPLFPVLTALGLSDISAGSQIAVLNQDGDVIAPLHIVNYLAFDEGEIFGEGEIDMSGVGLDDVFMAQNFGIYAPLSFFREIGLATYFLNGQVIIYSAEGVSVFGPDPLNISVEDIFPELASGDNGLTRYVPAEVGDTLILVNLTNQHLWYIVEGEIVLESPVVTGRPGIYATPTGVFGIMRTESPAVLRGPMNHETGTYEWESPVSYRIEINRDGIGFHDATWVTGGFGGEHHIYSGSRGCIWMPLDMISELFHMVSEGTPVVVHY